MVKHDYEIYSLCSNGQVLVKSNRSKRLSYLSMHDLKYFVGNTIKIETLWHNLYGLADGKLIYIPNIVSSIQQWEIIENTIKKELNFA